MAEHDDKLVEAVAAWLQKRRYIVGRLVMHPVEGGQPVAKVMAKNLLEVSDAWRESRDG